MAIQRATHVGICVSDLERSRQFYRDALGFEELARLDLSNAPTGQLLQIPGADVRLAFFERDGLRIELICFARPDAIAGPRPRPMNQLGFTHLAMHVDDLDATLDALLRAGAELLEDTRIELPESRARAAILLDPDGTRIELVESPGDPATPPGLPVR